MSETPELIRLFDAALSLRKCYKLQAKYIESLIIWRLHIWPLKLVRDSHITRGSIISRTCLDIQGVSKIHRTILGACSVQRNKLNVCVNMGLWTLSFKL